MMEFGRGGAFVPARVAPQGCIRRSSPCTMRVFLVWKRCCPPVSPCRGASIVHPPHTMRVFLIWKRRYADVRAGTQAPPLRFRLGGLRVGQLISFGQIARGMGDFVWGGLCVGGFVCWWENGAHDPTPSVLYFCQPRVADDRRLPWVKSWRGNYAIGIVLFKINFRVWKSFAVCGNDVR